MQGGIGHELRFWRRHLDDEEVRALVLVVRGADLDVVIAVVLGGDQVEPSDRARGFFTCVAAGAVLGLLLAVPVMVLFVVAILRSQGVPVATGRGVSPWMATLGIVGVGLVAFAGGL